MENRRSHPGDRLYYLGKYTAGEARECMGTAEAYNEAKETLTDRYGNKFTLYLEYMNTINSWPIIKANDGAGLRKFCDYISHVLAAMGSIQYLQVLNENRKVMSKLPKYIVDKWSRIVDTWLYGLKSHYPPFKNFVKFLKKESCIACGPVKIHQVKEEYVKESKREKPKCPSGARAFTSGTSEILTLAPSKPTTASSTCPLCPASRGTHMLEKCLTFLKMSLEDRIKLIKSKALCFGCLNFGHMNVRCKIKLVCDKCGLRHPTPLHNDNYQPKQNNRGSDIPMNNETKVTNVPICTTTHYVYSDKHSDDNDCYHSLIVPVHIYHDSNPKLEVCVYALIDEQSDACFVTDETLNRLKAAGSPVELCLSTVMGKNTVSCTKTSGLVVRGLTEPAAIHLPACYSRDTIPARSSQIPRPETVRKWPHLQRVADKRMPYNDTMEIGLLVGINCAKATMPRSVFNGNDGGPYGIKTALGWGVIGAICRNDDNVSRPHLTSRTQVTEISLAVVSNMMNAGFDFRDTDKKMSIQDRKFLNIVTDGICHRDDGHFELTD